MEAGAVPRSRADRKSGKGCWYFTSYQYCPVCASGETYRIRMTTPKPEDPAERYEYADAYDWCDAL